MRAWIERHPVFAYFMAVTIRRPPREVWPWLAQMGAGSRAGWYSYDLIDNRGRPSARRIVPELQNITVGMVLPALPGATDGFIVARFEPERFLVVGWPQNGGWLMTWAFVLEETEARFDASHRARARRTRLSFSRVAAVAHQTHPSAGSFPHAAQATARHRLARRA